MRQSISILFAGLLVSASILASSLGAIAHQHLTVGNVRATVHLEPDDSPYAGDPSPTWVHLTHANGETIRLADCICSLVIYNSRNQPIIRPQLIESEVEGHESPMTTSITFARPGVYRLVFTAQPKAGGFEPFELNIPVTVRR